MITLLLACTPPPRPDIEVHPVDTTTLVTTITVPGTDPPDTTTTTTTPEPVAPAIADLALVEHDDTIEVDVSVERGDAPLTDAVLEVTFDGAALELAIPDDLRSFDGELAQFDLDRPHVGECTLGASHEVEVTVVDRDGLASKAKSAHLDTADVGSIVPEIGETLASVHGAVPSGTTFCSDLDSVGNDGDQYVADLDYVQFQVPATGDWDLDLRWDVVGDYDLYVFEVDHGDWTKIDSSHAPDVHSPEGTTTRLVKGVTYGFEVAGWSGSPGDWTVELTQ